MILHSPYISDSQPFEQVTTPLTFDNPVLDDAIEEERSSPPQDLPISPPPRSPVEQQPSLTTAVTSPTEEHSATRPASLALDQQLHDSLSPKVLCSAEDTTIARSALSDHNVDSNIPVNTSFHLLGRSTSMSPTSAEREAASARRAASVPLAGGALSNAPQEATGTSSETLSETASHSTVYDLFSPRISEHQLPETRLPDSSVPSYTPDSTSMPDELDVSSSDIPRSPPHAVFGECPTSLVL